MRVLQFPIEEYAREARTVVLARQPDVSSDRVEVLECWRGDVPPGTALRVQWLDRLAAVAERTVLHANGIQWYLQSCLEDLAAGRPVPPISRIVRDLGGGLLPVMSGAREVLFLGPVEGAEGVTPSATFIDALGPSLIYLEGDEAFGPQRADFDSAEAIYGTEARPDEPRATYFGAGLFALDGDRPASLPFPVSAKAVRARVLALRAPPPGSRPSRDEVIGSLAEILPPDQAGRVQAAADSVDRDGDRAIEALMGILDAPGALAAPEPSASPPLYTRVRRASHVVCAIARVAGFRTVEVLSPALWREIEALSREESDIESPDRESRIRDRFAVAGAMVQALARTRDLGARAAIERARAAAPSLAKVCEEELKAFRDDRCG